MSSPPFKIPNLFGYCFDYVGLRLAQLASLIKFPIYVCSVYTLKRGRGITPKMADKLAVRKANLHIVNNPRWRVIFNQNEMKQADFFLPISSKVTFWTIIYDFIIPR